MKIFKNYSTFLFMILIISSIGLVSCSEYDDIALEVAGQYDARVVNGAYDFDVSISLDGDDNVRIEGLFDDYDWEVIRADLDSRGDGTIDFDIRSQNVYGGFEMWGDGIYDRGYLQLDYKIDWGYETIRYTLTAQRY